MKRKVVLMLLFVAILVLCLAAWAPADRNGDPRNPTLFQKRFQCNQIAASFPVDPAVARQWVPPPFELALDAGGNATGVVNLLYSHDYSFYATPNSPPLDEGANLAPDYVVHFWFALQGPVETIPVPGAMVTSPTTYFYDVADLVTGKEVHSLYRRAGRPAILVSNITLIDLGRNPATGNMEHMAEITFLNRRRITLEAVTPPRPATAPPVLKLGGNVWQWHVGGLGEMGSNLGARLDAAYGNPSNVSTTKVQYLGLAAGIPNATQTIIHSDPGTCFGDIFGMNDVISVKGTVFQPNNIVLNASRGDLLWTTYPSPLIPVPPDLP